MLCKEYFVHLYKISYMEEMENKRRKKYDNIECVQPGFANGVAGDFPLTEE